MRRASTLLAPVLTGLVALSLAACDAEEAPASDPQPGSEVEPPVLGPGGKADDASASANALGVCPEAARYATNGAGQAFCVFEDITLPDAEVDAYCHYLTDGYIGFSWTEGPATAGYACPEGSYYGPNGQGTGYCVFDDLGLPSADGLAPYCHYLDDGYLGYYWDMCPAEARYAPNGSGQGYCVWDQVSLPPADDLAAYCDYLHEGYIGFSWTDTPATAGYTCPEGARQTDNGAGLSFCLFEDLWLPPAEDLAPYCHYLDDGYFGFSWSL